MPVLDVQLLLLGWAASVVFLLAMWIVQRRTLDAGISDVGWALSLAGMAIAAALLGDGGLGPRVLVGVLGGVWGLRLGLHLVFDRVLGHSEDGRYRYLREHWGAAAQRKFFGFFQLQAFVAAVLSIPFLVAVRAPSDALTGWHVAGLLVFAAGKTFEIVADRQLARFRAEPSNRGHTCRVGLWRLSRHPNYFGEWILWWGFALVAWPAPGGAWALLAPLAMYLMITRVSGIPYTEAQALRSRGDDYRRYQRETNAFFPWPRAASRDAAAPSDRPLGDVR
ncbi:MAG: DUF1295 domain-containing protein [Planctomycetes bacterium]|nr:DUF1295 domain-containing protein [Planctomycetota bacterium]